MVTGYRAQRGLPSKSVPNRIRYRTIRYKIFVTTELEYIFLNIVLYLLWNTFNHREFYQVDPLNCHLSAVSRDTRPHDNQRSIERLCIEHILYESHKSRLNHDLPLKLILEIGVANIRIFGSQKTGGRSFAPAQALK